MGLFRRKAKKAAPVCSVVVVAAGSSARMGQDKIMMQVGDLPVIVHTLKAFESVPEVAEVVVVTRDDLISEIAGLCKVFDLQKVTKVVCGGSTRAESSRIGALEVRGDTPLIAVHDGARPFVSEQVIRAVIEKAAAAGAAAPAIPVKDTIKVARNGVVESTPDRSTLFCVQTPQVFDASLLRAALQKAVDDGADVTDDCSAVERMGMKVALTPGDERNIKLTTPDDIRLAEAILMEV
ncbi:MAG: 2-C-methyl-D-erythritol 4-phosphate cytidylyltransferase [Oscillospiraceae bacterium]|nr:2-C-methyl-D-erythritol 4-phosphate cytidylyltransferase [Oscillospiraceae bacterium]